MENSFWKICEILDNAKRVDLLRYLLEIEKTSFPCVIEIAETFGLSVSTTSAYLRKLADAGLVASKRADKRIYYRAFPSTPEGDAIVSSLRAFFKTHPDETRLRELGRYIHALSHYRRNALVRCLAQVPGQSPKELAPKTDIPYPTVDRLLSELNRAQIVDLTCTVVPPGREPEATFLRLTLS